jgi:hypothetical protein
MTTLKVDGHVCGDKNGVIFLQNGAYLDVTREVFEKVMKELIKNKKLQVSENLTLIY